MISPTESSRVAACGSMGLPHLIVALGCTRPARRVVRDGPAAVRVTWKEYLCTQNNQGEAGLSCGVWWSREGVKGLVEAVVQEELQPGSPRSVRSNSGSLRLRSY
jgi:hypothetical protein